jgi:hypothetical protein
MMTARALKSVNRFAVLNHASFSVPASPIMSFALFLLIYIAVAIALVAVIWLILRDLRRKRHGKAQPPRAREPRERRAPKAAFPGRKKAPAAEPQPETPPAPRRRQLHTFAEAERTASEPAGDPSPVPAAVEAVEDYAQASLKRLEDAFERLQSDDITLDAYRAEVLAEQAAIEQRIAALGDDAEGAEMAAARAALESTRWCLDWADQQTERGV